MGPQAHLAVHPMQAVAMHPKANTGAGLYQTQVSAVFVLALRQGRERVAWQSVQGPQAPPPITPPLLVRWQELVQAISPRAWALLRTSLTQSHLRPCLQGLGLCFGPCWRKVTCALVSKGLGFALVSVERPSLDLRLSRHETGWRDQPDRCVLRLASADSKLPDPALSPPPAFCAAEKGMALSLQAWMLMQRLLRSSVLEVSLTKRTF
jgi:hypothetical protein